jgi:hypothetical protein
LLRIPLNLNYHPRPENHLEPILMNCDLVDQPPDQLFITFLDDRRMLAEEDAHFGDPFTQVIPAGIFYQCLLLLIAQTVISSVTCLISARALASFKSWICISSIFFSMSSMAASFSLPSTVAMLFCKVARKVSRLFRVVLIALTRISSILLSRTVRASQNKPVFSSRRYCKSN